MLGDHSFAECDKKVPRQWLSFRRQHETEQLRFYLVEFAVPALEVFRTLGECLKPGDNEFNFRGLRSSDLQGNPQEIDAMKKTRITHGSRAHRLSQEAFSF